MSRQLSFAEGCFCMCAEAGSESVQAPVKISVA